MDGSASNATLTTSTPLDLTPYAGVELSFEWLIESGLDRGEYLALDLFDGSNWVEVAILRGNVDAEDVWHHQTVALDSGFLVSNFQFRFRATMNRSDEDAHVDNVRLVATGLAGPHNNAPLAVADAAATDKDVPVIVNVLANDSDADGDVLSVTSVTTPSHGSAVVNLDHTISYTPVPGFTGIDTFNYTITDGVAQSTATVSIEVRGTSVGTPLYVYDIRFESKRGSKDWRAVFEIRSDSNNNGAGDSGDAVVQGVAITVNFAGITYTGTTGADGVFRTAWFNDLAKGTHYANVVDLAMASYYWDMLMDLEDDSNGDGKPDDVLVR